MKTKEKYKFWRKRIFLTLWITYAAFYLCRVNMSIAMPGIMAEFGISKTAMGGVLTALFIAYAAGQFINGQLGDRFGARKLIFIGIIFSAIINIIFGFTNGVIAGMMLLWGLNGYFQSMGWAPVVKTIANWFPPNKRGRAGGLMGTSYQIGNAASWALAGLIVGSLGWRWAFWIPAAIFFLSGIHWFIRGRNAPEEVGLPTIEEENKGIKKSKVKSDHHLGFVYTLGTVLKNPKIWIVGLGLFCLNIIRYGFMSWAPTYMFEVQQATISLAAYKAVAIPIAGCLGAIIAGRISDKMPGLNRAKIAAAMLFLLGLFAFLYPKIPANNWLLSLICLLGAGFMTYGPHVLMVGTMAMDFATRKAASSAAGFIDCLGYIGAALTGVGTGWLIDNFSWNAAFYFWVAGAAIAAILMLMLWNYKPPKRKYH